MGHDQAVDGCDREGVNPHHVVPWWLVKRTRLRDLAPLCTLHHHNLHEGGRTLRLRDGRSIHPEGWVDEADASGAAARASLPLGQPCAGRSE